MLPRIYRRYVDDGNLLSRRADPGRTYNGNEIFTNEVLKETKQSKNEDEITKRLMNEIGNSIHKSIQLTPDKKKPILN